MAAMKAYGKDWKKTEYYMGINDIKKEGSWEWYGVPGLPATGKEKTWSKGEPNNANKNEDCTYARHMDKSDNLEWND